MSATLRTLSEHRCFGGVQRFIEHDSLAIGLPMRFSVFLPAQATAAAHGTVPALIFLAGLTCNEETFMAKAGAQRVAAALGLALIAPDTSPRGAAVEAMEGATASWDFGIGAGFYLNATQAPWSSHFRMEDYVVNELRGIAIDSLGVDPARIGLFGHSMGGHGALTLALRHPGLFKSLSAFAPIAAPSDCPWGTKAFTGYLGEDRAAWQQHDASALMAKAGADAKVPYPQGILIDQGLGDKFLEAQLQPERFEAACAQAGQPLTLRRHAGYDHGYYFISSFIEDHLRFHHERLKG